jgi:serine/threonine protein kinase
MEVITLRILKPLLLGSVCSSILDYLTWGRMVSSNPTEYPSFNLIGSNIRLGRDPKCEYKIEYPGVSRVHCIINQDMGFITLENLSPNGSWINKKRAQDSHKIFMRKGDVLELARDTRETVQFTLFLDDNQLLPQLGDYEIGSLLGTGSSAKVHRCINTKTKVEHAMKIIDKKAHEAQRSIETQRSIERFREEVKILNRLEHSNIVKLIEAFETEDFCCIVLEWIEGEDLLEKMLQHGQEFTEEQARKIFIQLVYALIHLHDADIVHRDLKPENILISNTETIKVIDFGLSTTCEEKNMSAVLGTPAYVAPEVIANIRAPCPQVYSKAIDVWSLGVILYMLLCGEPPFDPRKPTPILEQVKKGEYRMPEDLRMSLSSESRNLVSRLLQTNVQKRILLDQVINHPWLRQS